MTPKQFVKSKHPSAKLDKMPNMTVVAIYYSIGNSSALIAQGKTPREAWKNAETKIKLGIKNPYSNNITDKIEGDKELLSFADFFSKNYKIFSAGDYTSVEKKYKINYVEKIDLAKFGAEKKGTNTARIGHVTGIIELNKKWLSNEHFTPNFVYFLIIWLVIEKELHDNKLSDEVAIKFYLKTDRSKKDLTNGYLEMFRSAPSKINIEREKLLVKYLK